MLRIQKNIYIQWFLNKLGVFNFKISWADGKFKYFQSQISWLWGNTYLFLFRSWVIFLRGLFFLMFDMKKTYPGEEKKFYIWGVIIQRRNLTTPLPPSLFYGGHYSFLHCKLIDRPLCGKITAPLLSINFPVVATDLNKKNHAFLKPKLGN